MLYPSQIIKSILSYIECIATDIRTSISNSLRTVSRSVTEETTGSGTIPAGWISVTIINQGNEDVTLDGAHTLLPGSYVTWDLKDFANTGDSVDWDFGAATGSILIVEVR